MPGKKGGSGKTRKYPGISPTSTQLGMKAGRRYEDGSFRTKSGGTFDPDTGRIRRTKKK